MPIAKWKTLKQDDETIVVKYLPLRTGWLVQGFSHPDYHGIWSGGLTFMPYPERGDVEGLEPGITAIEPVGDVGPGVG